MDFYLSHNGQPHISAPDSLSLQEMLDMDIKSENDFESVFSCGDLNLNFTDFPALNFNDDSLGPPGDNNVWLTSSTDSHSLLGGDFNSSFSLDFNSDENRMVCPNSVMPVTLIEIPYEPPEAESDTKPTSDEVTPSSGSKGVDKLSNKKPAVRNGLMTTVNGRRIKTEDMVVKEEPEDDDLYDDSDFLKSGNFHSELDIKTEVEDDGEIDEETFQEAYARAVAITNNQPTKGKVRITPAPSQISRSNSLTTRSPINNSTKRPVASVRSINSKKRLHDLNSSDSDIHTSVYPKPAYSYSCLIAMALKNSPNGSLPVSEIYNFMCQHFPYFKTAPNGWKNSVRHNLSLNKCFEKIEKPATNGNQRKGCLWAMNPNKIGKMDEEVQKWSKKDKLAIKKSMIYPDSLDALERGELAGNYNHNPGSIETIHSDVESEEDTWEQRQNEWSYKQETEDEDEEDEEGQKLWSSRQPTQSAMFPETDASMESDLSLSDFEQDEPIYKNMDTPDKLKMRLNPQSPNGELSQLAGIGLSGGTRYTIGANNNDSPKRLKTLGGNTISGNYVYKPLGTSSASRRKSPLRPTLITSLEADD